MKTLKNILLILVLGFSIKAYTQQPLQEYLQTAALNNPLLKAKFNQYLAAMEKVPQVGTLPDPQLTFGYFISTPETRVGAQQWSVSLMQKFPWFGLLKTQKDAATLFAKAKFEEFEQAKSNLFFEVKNTYYKHYFVSKAITITQENLQILETIKRLSLIKIEAGKTTMADELRIEMEINELQNQLALLNNKKQDLQVAFQNLLDTAVVLQTPDSIWIDAFSGNYALLLDSIYVNNNQLQSIQMRIEAFMKQQIVAKKKGSPSFAIGAGYTNVASRSDYSGSDNGKDIFMFPSFTVSIPLYRKKYAAMIKEAALNAQAQADLSDNLKNKLHTVFEKTTTEYEDAERRILLYKKQRILAKKALDILIISYSTDTKDFDEVLRMERLLLQYELEEEKAKIDKNIAVAFSYYLLGK
jgi:outer membrane protein TolC